MQKNSLETLIGFAVITIAGLFLYKSYNVTQVNYGTEGSYSATAKFERIDGLSVGSDIKIGGIKIGKVSELKLDPKTYQAVATFNLKKEIAIPVDSTAAVSSDGLFGGKYVSIIPGSESDMLKEHGFLEFTQSPVNLENLLGKYIFNNNSKDSAPHDATKS